MGIKALKFILIYLAGLLLVLHSLVPHHHHDELTEEEHQKEHSEAETLLDYLELLFHNDIGEEHLEHFQNSDGFNLEFSKAFDSNPLSAVKANNIMVWKSDNAPQTNLIHHPKRIPIPPLITALSLRGPPSIS